MKRVLFIADAGPQVGGGHVMRCLTLAGALTAQGARCAFVATAEVGQVLDRFAPAGIERAEYAFEPADVVVFDHYELDAEDHRRLAAGRPAVVIDDLADRPLGADLVLDPGPQRTPGDYAPLAPGARLLLGPAYALVRPEFAQRRPAALAKPRDTVRTVLVAMGLTDVGAITARVVEAILPLAGEAGIEAVVALNAPSRPRLTALAAADRRLVLRPVGTEMTDRMAAADVAVGAGGSSTWERCVLGLPSLMLVLAENQRPGAQALEAAGAALVAAQGDDLGAAFSRLMGDADLRRRLAERSAALCDGEGAARVAEACLQLIA